MFEEGEEGGLAAMHHPFTSPRDMSPEELAAAPVNAIANAYDMVINGYEVGGGSVRIHRSEMQQTVFSILGINEHEQREVRLPAGRVEVRYAAARRPGFRPGSSGDAVDRHRQHPRRHRLPENHRGGLSDDRRTELRQPGVAAGAGYQRGKESRCGTRERVMSYKRLNLSW